MTDPEPTIRVAVDPTNPGQFFACCGLLELADRFRPAGAEGWFVQGDREFRIRCEGDLPTLVREVSRIELVQLDEDDKYSTRVRVSHPSRPLDLDWWHELGSRPDAKDLKVWAGTMESYGIAKAMQKAMQHEVFQSPGLFDVGMVVQDVQNPANKKEPYYFDARRGPNAHSRDVGFSPNDLGMTTTAYPAVEFLCLVGLQRCLPVRTKNKQLRVYDYHTWADPIPPELLPVVVPGVLPMPGGRGYRFENWFRTGQKKHKAFRSATPILQGD